MATWHDTSADEKPCQLLPETNVLDCCGGIVSSLSLTAKWELIYNCVISKWRNKALANALENFTMSKESITDHATATHKFPFLTNKTLQPCVMHLCL